MLLSVAVLQIEVLSVVVLQIEVSPMLYQCLQTLSSRIAVAVAVVAPRKVAPRIAAVAVVGAAQIGPLEGHQSPLHWLPVQIETSVTNFLL